jgi:hypothetical protein
MKGKGIAKTDIRVTNQRKIAVHILIILGNNYVTPNIIRLLKERNTRKNPWSTG